MQQPVWTVILAASLAACSAGKIKGGQTIAPDAAVDGPKAADAGLGAVVILPGEQPDAGALAAIPDAGSSTTATGTTAVRGPQWLHTSGASIVDETGAPVRITGLTWYGLDTAQYAPDGLAFRAMSALLDEVRTLGYNVVRIPFSTQLLDAGSLPVGIDLRLNPGLAGKAGVALIDAVVAEARAQRLRVILVRQSAGASEVTGLWYTPQYSEERWISDWHMLATRYANDPTVIGYELHSEPHDPATWGDGQLTDWQRAASTAGDAILAVNPRALILVDGIQTYGGAGYLWGSNLIAVMTKPVALSVPNQVVYAVHEYPASVVGALPEFTDPTFPASLDVAWQRNWGYIADGRIAPVLIAEFGTTDVTDGDRTWFRHLAAYITAHNLHFIYFCLNPDASATGGIVGSDWTTVNMDKQSVLQPLLAAPLP